MPRSIWKGAISFGLVSIPVGLYTATENRSPSFKQLRKDDHSPIRYKRVAESDGKEVEWDDIVRGYEFEKGRYVVFTDEELEAAGPSNGSRLVDVIQFVDESEIDPLMYQKSYYLAPEKTGLKAYKIFAEAIEEQGVVGIAKVAIREKQHLATLRAKDGILIMETMFWPDEIRAADFEELEGDVEIRPEELKMAESLVENLTRAFDSSEFVDTTRQAIEEAAAKKVAGEEIIAPESPEPTKVVDLLEALKASVEATKTQKKAG
ncbi:MAG TPA: Ku protein [Acidimicrobiia bacterium]|jgi:DNA end-binding protein Ku|nr:Ku protein [Acidimicrobiia bacterium]